MLVLEQRGDKGYENLIKNDLKVGRNLLLLFWRFPDVGESMHADINSFKFDSSAGPWGTNAVGRHISGWRAGVGECPLGRGRR